MELKQGIKVYFIIVNYNGIDDTIECINSIKKAQFNNDTDVNIIVVDNNSSEDKTQLISFCKTNKVMLLELENNYGFGYANNAGAILAEKHGADYLILLNNDTVIKENFFLILKENIRDDAILSPLIYYYGSNDKIWYGGGCVSKIKGTSIHYDKYRKENTFATGCCLIIPIDIYNRYGLFDEKYFMYYEDTDLSIKWIEEDISIIVIPDLIIWHKVGSSSNKVSGLKEYYLNRNRLYMINKHQCFFLMPVAILYFYITRLLIFIKKIVTFDNTYKYMIKGIIDFYKDKK